MAATEETASAGEPGLLAGIRVLDFTAIMAGPYCTRLLSDVGAEVIHIETREGDLNRTRAPVRNGYSALFGHLHAGKRNVCLDLKSPAGKEAALALADRSDVVVENWRPGVAKRLGFGYDDLARRKPDLVYCSISGYGQSGPWADHPALAGAIHAASGFDLAQMEVDEVERPQKTGIFLADLIGGLAAFGAIQGALFQRERSGNGQYIDVAMIDALMNMLVFEVQQAQFGRGIRRLQTPLKTADGFIIVLPVTEANFRDTARAVGHPEWIEDPRFALLADRDRHWFELLALIEEWTSARSGEECERVLRAGGVPCARHRTVDEWIDDPYAKHRDLFATVRDGAGEFLVTNPPFRLPGLDIRVRPRIADIGEDTAAVLAEVLGYDAAQVAAADGRKS